MSARSSLSASNTANTANTATALRDEADGLLTDAQRLRREAREAQGAEKENKNAEADRKEELATEKLIEASQVTAQDNEAQFRIGDGNLQKLVVGAVGEGLGYSERTTSTVARWGVTPSTSAAWR